MSLAASPWFLMSAGLLAGIVLGFTARANHFCTMSSLERWWYAGDGRGLRTWALAGGVALVGTQILQALGHVDTAASFYIRSDFGWVGAIAGGVLAASSSHPAAKIALAVAGATLPVGLLFGIFSGAE